MPGTTTRGFPFPLPTDPPDGAPQIEALARAIDSDNGRIDTLTRTINASVFLEGARSTALPAATATAIDLTVVRLAPGPGLVAAAQGSGLAIEVTAPCRLRLDGWLGFSVVGDTFRVTLGHLTVDAVPGWRFHIGALVTGAPQRVQGAYWRNGATEAVRADAILPGVWSGQASNWVHTSVTAHLVGTILST